MKMRYGLVITLAVVVLMHLPFMSEPPRSIHVWRQCNTLSMARNFFEEGMNILEPKVDRRMDGPGITGSQFLSYEWILAVLYKLFGFHESFSRWLSLCFYLIAIGGMYAWLRQLFTDIRVAVIGSWLLAFSPELFYHGINALPDILALAAAIWGLAAFFYARRKGYPWLHCVSSMLLISIAGLTKLQYLATGVPIAWIFFTDWRQRKIPNSGIAAFLGSGLPGILACLAWYYYAHLLIAQSGLKDIGIVFRPETNIAAGLKIISRNIISDLPELLMGYGGIICLIIGLIILVKQKATTHPLFIPFLLWAMILIMYHLVELAQMGVHQYYMLPYFPLLFITAALGGRALLAHNKHWLWFLLILPPLFAAVRIIPARWVTGKEGIPMSFYDAKTRQQLTSLVPDTCRIVTGPDVSGTIQFYFLHKKGFCYERKGEAFLPMWNGVRFIDDAIHRGARYAYITDESEINDPRWKEYVEEELFRNDEIRVVKLRAHSE